jgi:ArsR family transcriptional regulator, arsenate/arsenite/antimonite-responsive transcriptional repressor
MTIAKTELFNIDLQNASALFKALSHPARLAILQFLSDTKLCITGDICEELPLSRTTVNQHLKELKEIGLIKGEIEGVKVNYCLNTEKIKQLETILTGFLSGLNPCKNQNC